MKLSKYFLEITFFICIMILISCSSGKTKISDATITVSSSDSIDNTETVNSKVTKQPLSTKTIEPTNPISKERLQITYEKMDKYLKFGSIYAIDITCQEENQLCLGEPKLLFQTQPYSKNNLREPYGLISGHSWSPDGNKLVFSANKEIFLGDLITQKWENITNSVDLEENYPKWSSDGKFIYFRACPVEYGNGYCEIMRYDNEKKELSKMLENFKSPINSFTISIQNKIVIFAAPNGFDILYQSDPDGLNQKKLTITGLEESNPSFSPNAREFVFERNNRPILVPDIEEQSDIILRDVISGAERNLTENFSGEAGNPVFSFDGQWIVFNSFDENRNVNIFVLSPSNNIIQQITEDGGNLFPEWREYLGK